MDEVMKYPSEANREFKPFNVKKTLTFTLIGGAVACGIYYFVKKEITDSKASKSDAKSFQQGSPATIATQVNMALTTGTFGALTGQLRQILIGIKSKEELDQVKTEYLNQYHKQFNADIKSKVQSSEYDELIAIADAKPFKGKQVSNQVKYESWARRIKAAFDKKLLSVESLTAIDFKALEAALKEVPTQIAFINVGKAYYTLFKDNVMTVLKDRLHSWDYNTYLKIITDKPKGK